MISLAARPWVLWLSVVKPRVKVAAIFDKRGTPTAFWLLRLIDPAAKNFRMLLYSYCLNPLLVLLTIQHGKQSGSVEDDGLPSGTLVATWSIYEGPVGVAAPSFANILDPQTTVTFFGTGRYILKLTADDGALQETDLVIITVNP